MKILHIIPWIAAKYGGPVTAVIGLARAQAQIGESVSILATDADGAAGEFEQRLGDPSIQLSVVSPVSGPLLRNPGLGQMAEREVGKVDIVHIHSLYEEVQHQSAVCARAAGKPYLIRPCGMLDPWSMAQGKWKKRLYLAWRLRKNLKLAQALHFTTRMERDLTRPLGLGVREIVEPNGIELEEYAVGAENLFFRRFPFLQGSRFVVYLGRLLPTKGLELLIPAFGGCGDSDARLVLVGPGDASYRSKLEQLAESCGIGPKVTFTGELQGPEKIGALQAAELFILPSYHENFGNVVVEALACGTAALLSDQVQLWDEVVEGGVGDVFKLEVQHITDRLQAWLSDDDRRELASARTAEFVRKRFIWREIARRWSAHYRGIHDENWQKSPLANKKRLR